MKQKAKKHMTTGERMSIREEIVAVAKDELSDNGARKAVAIEYPCICGATLLALHTGPATDVNTDESTGNITANCRCTFNCTKCDVEVLEAHQKLEVYDVSSGECCQWVLSDGTEAMAEMISEASDAPAPCVTAQTHGTNFYGKHAGTGGDFYLAFVVYFICENCGGVSVDEVIHPVQLTDFRSAATKTKALKRSAR